MSLTFQRPVIRRSDDLFEFMSASKRSMGMKSILVRLWQEEEGQDLVEYGLLVVLIALGCILAMQGLASGISKAFSNAVIQLAT
jgi:Flp pilus assembly pilin Flp